MSLREKMEKFNSNEGIPFMKDRTKGDLKEILDQNVTLRDFAFIEGDDGKYVVFIVDEIGDTFFFGGKVLTDNLLQLTEEEKEEVKQNGLPLRLFESTNKKGRVYINVKYYPEPKLPF